MPQLKWICEICGFGYNDQTVASSCEMRHVRTKGWRKASIVDMRYADEFRIFPDLITIRYTEEARDDRIYAITNAHTSHQALNGHTHRNSKPVKFILQRTGGPA